MRTCLVGEGHRGWGPGEPFCRWWASGKTLDEEVRVVFTLVAVGVCCSVFLSSFQFI